ncbi:TPA: hypothetical protein ACQZCI_004306 [Escherichia coli]
MKPETEIDETGSFGEPEEKPAPFWKRSVWGISVATWGLCAVVLLAAIWYLFLRAPSETGMPPFNDADAGVQTWQTTQESSPSVQSTETMTVRTGEDMSQLARDVKTELDTDPSTLRRVRRRSFSIIDNRNRKGYITRRYQCFPLAPLPEDRKYDSLPDLVLHPEQETIKCKEKHYSQPL